MDCGIRNREGDMSHHKVSPKKDGEARLKRALTIAGTIAGQSLNQNLKISKASLYSQEKNFLFNNCGILLCGFLLFCCKIWLLSLLFGGRSYCFTIAITGL